MLSPPSHTYNVKQGIETDEYIMKPISHTNDHITEQLITNCQMIQM